MAGMNTDARTFFFYIATVNTPAMVAKMVGKGSQYALATMDAAGNPLDGAKSYKLNLPRKVPAARFWSVCLYDPQTRSELQTGQPYPSKNNTRDKMVANGDGSIDLYFGPPEARRMARKRIGWRPSPARAGSRCFGPTARWSRGSTRLGAPGRLKRCSS
jgi:hypothetical protein